ncbi:tetratricopeptide repeat protein [Luteimonas sp. MJ293]|uniref:tetratricopeptide repeat protein n=1 Tax=Luteimonas sp. MJ146 TaxID=3129240 RepID=UPI0031BA623A
MKSITHAPALIALAVAAALAGAPAAEANAAMSPVVTEAAADECQRSRRGSSAKQEVEERYPNATREAPGETASTRMSQRLNRLNTAMQDDEFDKVLEHAEDILGQERANDYDRAFAAQMAGHAAYNADDMEAAKRYTAQAVELNGLDNNNHFQAMFMLVQLHAQDEETEQALTLLDRYFAESGSTDANDLILHGQLLYQADRFAEAVPVLRQAIDTAESPQASWTQLLMAAYMETGQDAEATALAEQIAGAAPDDKRSQLNLASMYMQADQNAKAIEVMERLRASGQLTEDREYRNLMALHLNSDGGEAAAIAVINDGLEKGVLESNHQTYLALAQAHYFSEQVEPAIEAYRKAAPLDSSGETYLNLARILYGEGREAEAADAARQALSKGVKRPEDAQRIIGN